MINGGAMRSCASRAATGLLLMLAPLCASAASDFWTYSYKDIEVTAQGNSVFTVNVARYCARLDALLVQILAIKTDYRIPTHIYVLPEADIHRLTEANFSSGYLTSPWSNTVLMDAGARPNGRPYWGAFFGYTATLLASERRTGPDWYRVGVASVFADTVFEKGEAKIGNITPAFAYTLTRGGAMYPMRTFLSLPQRESVKEGENQMRIWNAQAWYVARLVFVEGWHRAEFFSYLGQLRAGHSEAEAFAASFKVSYEDLDREMARAMRDAAHIYVLPAPEDPAAATESAQPLTTAEWRGRIAGLYTLYNQPQQAVQIAQEALRLEPANQSALRALARAQLEAHAYADALATLGRAGTQDQSLAACLDRARVLSGLAQAVASGDASLSVDAASLKQRAREDYQHALTADPGNREAHSALGSAEVGG